MRKLAPAVLTGMASGAVIGAALALANHYFNERWQAWWSELDLWVLSGACAGAALGAGVGGLTGLVIAAFRYEAGNAKFR